MIALVVAIALAALLGAALIGIRLIERGYPPMGRFVDVDGGRLHVVEIGASDAPPILLLHGASGNLGDLKLALGDRLAARYRVILVDRPGHGWSDRPNGAADASPAAQAASFIRPRRASACAVRSCSAIPGRARSPPPMRWPIPTTWAASSCSHR